MRSRTRPLHLLLAALALASCTAAPAHVPRSERSPDLSHITGSSRDIQMFIKNRFIQVLPDGTVNGTFDVNSEYTRFQRRSLTNPGSGMAIQSVATCLYLCMDQCGFQYAHKDLSEDCMFDEHMEQNNYNTYSRVRNGKKTFLAIDNKGHARRLQIPLGRPLGNLSTYALALTNRWKSGNGHHSKAKCPPRRHKGKLRQPPPFHRNCQKRVDKENRRKLRKNKKLLEQKRKLRHSKTRRKHESDNFASTTTEDLDDLTASTVPDEFFRWTTVQ